MAQREQANVPLLLTIGAVSGFLIIVLSIGLQAWFLREVQNEVRVKWENVPLQPISDMKQRQLESIQTYHWVGDNKQHVAIPIDQAMKMVVVNQGKLPTTKPQ